MNMIELLDPEVLTHESTSAAERIGCIGICHNGPIDEAPRALRYAAHHDPDASAAFLMICTGCDNQLSLCAKKVDSLLESSLLGSGYMKCPICP